MCSVCWPLSAQLSSERYAELMKLYQKGDQKDVFHELSNNVMGMESYAERGDDSSKQLAITQAINLAATVLATRDVAVSTDTAITNWPRYDGTEFGGLPVFSGVDPESIKDPRVKSRLLKELEDHRKLMHRLGIERQKEDAANYALEFVQRMIDAAKDKERVAKAASDAIKSLAGAAWIKDYERAHVFPPTEQNKSNSETAPAVHPIPQKAPDPRHSPQSVSPSLTKKIQLNTAPAPSPASQPQERRSDNSVKIVAAIIAAIGVLGSLYWFLRR